MDLFTIVNNHAFPSVHALLIEPFKSIWENDTSVARVESIKIFTYIELVASPKKSNPFFGYTDEERPYHVKREVWGDNTPDQAGVTVIIAAVAKYKELLMNASPTYSLFDSALSAANKLKDELNNLNFRERTRGGAAVIKPKDVTTALKDIPDTIKSLELLRSKVNQELLEESKTRNQRAIGEYER